MAKYKVNAFPRKPYVHTEQREWIITEVRTNDGALVLKVGEVVELSDRDYARCFQAQEGEQEPLYPPSILTRIQEASAAPQKPAQDEAAKVEPKAKASGDKPSKK